LLISSEDMPGRFGIWKKIGWQCSPQSQIQCRTWASVVSFGQDNSGNLYVIFDGKAVYQVVERSQCHNLTCSNNPVSDNATPTATENPIIPTATRTTGSVSVRNPTTSSPTTSPHIIYKTTGNPTTSGPCLLQNNIQIQPSPTQLDIANTVLGNKLQESFAQLQDGFEIQYFRSDYKNNMLINTMYKQRLLEIIEFMDTGDAGYQPNLDVVVQQFSGFTWNPFQYSTSNQFSSNTNDGLFSVHGFVDMRVSACFVEVPNPTIVDFSLNFTPLFQKEGSKLAVSISFKEYRDVNNTKTSFPNYQTMNGEIMAEYLGFQTFNSFNGVPVVITTADLGSAEEPTFMYYYSLNSLDHSLTFSIPMTRMQS